MSPFPELQISGPGYTHETEISAKANLWDAASHRLIAVIRGRTVDEAEAYRQHILTALSHSGTRSTSIVELSAQLRDTCDRNIAYITENQKLKVEIFTVREELDEAKSALATRDQALDAELADWKGRFANLQKDLDGTTRRTKDLEWVNDCLRSMHAGAHDEFHRQVKEIASLNRHLTERDDQSNRIAELIRERDSFQRELGAANGTRFALTRKLDAIQSALDD